MIQWADERFAFRFAGGPKPKGKARNGQEHAKLERMGWYKHLLAYTIGTVILAGMILCIGNFKDIEPLFGLIKIWSTVLAIDFAISFSYTIWPKKVKNGYR